MPGTFIVKPIEANLTYNSNFIHKMNPYCSFIVDGSRVKGPICHRGGKHPHWNDVVTFPDTDEPMIPVEIMDKDKLSHDDNIGSFTLDLQEVQRKGHVNKWYPLYYKDRQAGNILLETVFQPGRDHHINTSTHHETIFTSRPEPVIIKEEHVVIEQDTVPHSHNKVFTEQKQIIEPHTFVKEVEVVENRPAVKEIEVMEPVKVVKDVQVTEAVPVKKHIKVTEPEIVTKEVEVMEPRLVTKTIQVVEDVPVKKEIEVVEMKNTVQEVETVEPQTVTEQIEVTEYVPVKKAVEVTQPVTVKKAVEFVEPVITTNTVTKEVKEPVVIGEKITKTVGPARVTDASQVTDDYREKIYAAADLLNDIDMSVDVKTEPCHHRQEEIISTKQYKEEIEVKNEEKRV